MKYISTLIFTLALIYSWKLVHEESPVNFETHAAIQLKLVETIRKSILELKPTAKNINILNVSTETINDHTLKTYFSYKFEEPDETTGELVEQEISGEAQLKKSSEPNSTEEKWVLENVTTQTGTMNFKNGIVITPNSSEEKMIPLEETPSINTTPVPSPTSTPTEAPQAIPITPDSHHE